MYITCSKKLTDSQLGLPHGTNKKCKRQTKNKLLIFGSNFVNFLFCFPCGRLSWGPATFLLHVKVSYRVVKQANRKSSCVCERSCLIGNSPTSRPGKLFQLTRPALARYLADRRPPPSTHSGLVDILSEDCVECRLARAAAWNSCRRST